MRISRLLIVAALHAAIMVLPRASTIADDELPPLLYEDFEAGASRWAPLDDAAWKVDAGKSGQGYNQFAKSSFNPPHRSPFNLSLLKDVVVGDFVLECDVKSTAREYDHRDACIAFGYQDPAHFYYVHLGKRADDHANQIFIVNDAPRTKISTTSTPGTDWKNDVWHHVKIVRNVESGAIEIYFDDMTKPVMTATDKTFTWGQVGIGTFDDTAIYDNINLRGKAVER